MHSKRAASIYLCGLDINIYAYIYIFQDTHIIKFSPLSIVTNAKSTACGKNPDSLDQHS
jgi:hypothetical protein